MKAIKHALNQVLVKDGAGAELTDEILERDMNAALQEFKDEAMESGTSLAQVKSSGSMMTSEEKMEQFQQIMNLIIGRALEVNNEKLSQDVSALVNERVAKELDELQRASDERQEERFRQLDETIRAFQKDGREEAAAAKIPFFKRKRFGRGGRKMREK